MQSDSSMLREQMFKPSELNLFWETPRRRSSTLFWFLSPSLVCFSIAVSTLVFLGQLSAKFEVGNYVEQDMKHCNKQVTY